MVANVASLLAAPNKASAPQAAPAASSSGASFASMLNNEIQSSASPKPSAAEAPANASPAPNQPSEPGHSGNAKSAASSGASAPGASGTKKSDRTDPKGAAQQTDAATAAAAATAATLAAAASGATASASVNAIANAASVTQDASAVSAGTAAAYSGSAGSAGSADTAVSSTASALSGFGAAAAGLAHDLSTKTALNNGSPNTASTTTSGNTSSSKAPGAPGVTQSAVAESPALMGASAGKNSSGHPGEFRPTCAALSNSGKAPEVPLPVSATAAGNQPANGSAAAPITDNLPSAAAPLENIKSANQDLSAQQLNAIAPVLTTPPNLAAAASASTIAPQVGATGWDQAVGQKINWMVSGGQSSASLTLNPPELGPMQIVLTVNNQHASATFISHQPEVRAALENAIPRLREMMEQSGIQLGQCDVSSQSRQPAFAQNQSGSGANRSTTGFAAPANNDSVMASNSVALPRSGVGLVDTFV